MEVNVEPTAEIIDTMVDRLKHAAIEMRRVANRMRESADLAYASEAIVIVTNLPTQLRLDLLVTRPIRELVVKGNKPD